MTTKQEILQKYEAFARWYDLAELLPEVLGLRSLRQRLLGRASGAVLEVAVGTARNLPYYPRSCQLTAVDLSPAMLTIARKRATKLGLPLSFEIMDAEKLAFPDQTFDTVVDTLGLCTFPDPLGVLREMVRVCRPNGRLLLLEHGRSDRQWLGRWQDKRADRHAKHLGCRWNREPLDLLRQAGLKVLKAEHTFLGIFHLLEASPPERGSSLSEVREGSIARLKS